MLKLKVDKVTQEKAQAVAAKLGYATLEDLFTHLIDQEHTKLNSEQADGPDPDVADRLKGLGYIE